jgi:hypothetical protein
MSTCELSVYHGLDCVLGLSLLDLSSLFCIMFGDDTGEVYCGTATCAFAGCLCLCLSLCLFLYSILYSIFLGSCGLMLLYEVVWK